jgi:DNA-binding beta-propeller fold protein YncE
MTGARAASAFAWPPPPAEACIVYVRSISRPADIGVKPTALKRLASWLSGGPQQSNDLEKPFGLALDDAGNLLVTDTGASAVICLDWTRKKWLRWEQVGKTHFASPVAVARYRDTIFVADSALGKVVAFDERGRLRFEISRELERPCGLALLGDRLYIADSQRQQIVLYDARGGFISKFGQRGLGPGQFNFPSHLAADGQNHLYVTDSLNYRVQVLDATGVCQGVIGSAGDAAGHFSRPKGVALDTSGHVYVVDALFDNVQIFDSQARLLLDWGGTGSAPGQFWLPNGIAIGRDNQIYVADSCNHRIQVFKYTGKQ